MNKTPLIYGLSFGIIKSTIVKFLPIEDVLKGFLSIIIFIVLLMFVYYKTKPNLKTALKIFIVFTIVFFATSTLLTYIYSSPGSELINVLIYEINRIVLFLITGLLITFFRLSKKHFFKLSSIVLLFFIGMFLFATFNIEMVQKLIDNQQKEQLKTDN
jgi:hypothetical protein